MTPNTIGRYQVVSPLGRGAMGQVFRAFDPNIGRPLAIKLIALEPGNPELQARFRREAQAAGLLSHPNIVTIYDAGADENGLFIAMELVEGETLQEILSRGPLPIDQSISITEQVASALDHAHAQQIVHRDIKPANIMVSQGIAKVADFGVAKFSSAGMTATGQILGTPYYMAPEVIKGESADLRSDIFSLGVVLYQMLTGTQPFPGENVSTVIYRVLSETPRPLPAANPRLSAGLNYAVLKALSKNPQIVTNGVLIWWQN